MFHTSGATGWVRSAPAPRPGNEFDVLIDGEAALTAVFDAISAAQRTVHIAGWHVSPGFRLLRAEGTPTLAELLDRIAERAEVRVLLWAGPPLPIFQPTRSDMKSVRDELTAGGRVQCSLDSRERTLHCHHEKVVVVDDEIAFVGGLDLSDLQGDRWDRNDHPGRSGIGWHDAATRLRGPIVAEVAEHFRQRWQESAGELLPAPKAPDPTGSVTVQLLRTVPERTYRFSPKGDFSIAAGYLHALQSARKLIYLENQFLWSTEVVHILADKLHHPPHPDFRLVLVLPAHPSNGSDTTRGQLSCLVDADGGAGRLVAATLIHPGTDAPAPYVHAKIGIIDDRWLTVGSANLNEHSMFNDTEVNVLTLDQQTARRTRLQLWAEHLGRPAAEIAGDPTTVIDTIWKPLTEQSPVDHLQHQPMARTTDERATRVTRLAAVSRRSERLIGPLRGLLVDA